MMKPLFLLAGGGPHKTKNTVSFLAGALKECGTDKPRVAYIGTASGDNLIFYTAIKALLHEAGAGEVFFPKLARKKADIATARQELMEADAIFLSGGEVEDGMRWLVLHGLVEFLKELRSRGTLFLGMSAGSIMMGTHWVRWEIPEDDTTAELFDCLGFVPTTFDTHAEDENWKELKMALTLQGPGARGYGIPRDGIAIVDAMGKMTTRGKPLLCYVNHAGSVQLERD